MSIEEQFAYDIKLHIACAESLNSLLESLPLSRIADCNHNKQLIDNKVFTIFLPARQLMSVNSYLVLLACDLNSWSKNAVILSS